MAIARTIKRHDTADPITGRATSQDEPTGVDLTIYTAVNLYGKATVSGVEVLFGGEVAEANSDGTWTYEQDDSDIGTAGTYDLELECITAGGQKVHFPNEKAQNPQLKIDEDLDDT